MCISPLTPGPSNKKTVNAYLTPMCISKAAQTFPSVKSPLLTSVGCLPVSGCDSKLLLIVYLPIPASSLLALLHFSVLPSLCLVSGRVEPLVKR